MKIRIKGTFDSYKLFEIAGILQQAKINAEREEEENELENLSNNPEELINRIVSEAEAVEMISMYGEHSDWVLKALEYVPIEELKSNSVFERFHGVYSEKIKSLIAIGENSKRRQNAHESEGFIFNGQSENGVELNIDQECNSKQVSEIINILRQTAKNTQNYERRKEIEELAKVPKELLRSIIQIANERGIVSGMDPFADELYNPELRISQEAIERMKYLPDDMLHKSKFWAFLDKKYYIGKKYNSRGYEDIASEILAKRKEEMSKKKPEELEDVTL